MPGTLIRAIAIIAPGMFLSQPPTQRTPSISCPFTAVSIESAITSRETSEYFMPSVPMPMASVTVGKPNTCGMAPAAFTAAMARSTSGWMPALQGFMVEWPLATPTIAFSKSPSRKPTARNIARFGERAAPWVMVLLLQLSAMGKTPNAENQLRFACILLESAPQPFHARASELRSGRDLARPDRDPLVRDHVSGRLRRGVLAGPAAHRPRKTGAHHHLDTRRSAVFLRAWRRSGRQARLRALLQAGILLFQSARNSRRLARR